MKNEKFNNVNLKARRAKSVRKVTEDYTKQLKIQHKKQEAYDKNTIISEVEKFIKSNFPKMSIILEGRCTDGELFIAYDIGDNINAVIPFEVEEALNEEFGRIFDFTSVLINHKWVPAVVLNPHKSRNYNNKKVTEGVEDNMNEAFYEKICRAYIDTVNLEWVTTNPENNNSVVHGYFADDEDANKYKDKITPENFKDMAYEGYTEEEIESGDVDWYEYETWEDFYEDYVKDEIAYDINDIGVYDSANDTWDFYISEEDLTKLGLWNEDIKSEFLGESKKVTESKEEDLYNELVTALTDYEGYGDPDYANDIEYVIDVLDNIKANWNLIVKTNKHNKEVENLYKTLSNALKDKNEKDLYHTGVLIQNNWEGLLTAELDESKKVESVETKQSIYDELSRVLTDYEGNGDLDLKDDPKPLYDILVKIQNNWEDVITAE